MPDQSIRSPKPSGHERRVGLTLIELLVSIVLIGVVALLVYGAVHAARATQTKITAERDALQSALAMRLLLETALAGMQSTLLAPDTIMILENRVGRRGTPQDRLTFTTSGDIPPLSRDVDWTVTLEATPLGLSLTGSPRGVRLPARVLARLPDVTGLAIVVSHHEIAGGWSEEWPLTSVLPEAVKLTYWIDSGPVGLPLVVSIPLGTIR